MRTTLPGNPDETSAVLNMLVIEDLATAVYSPVVAALVVGRSLLESDGDGRCCAGGRGGEPWGGHAVWGHRLSALLAPGSKAALLLAAFGLTLLVGGLAEQLQVSSAIAGAVVAALVLMLVTTGTKLVSGVVAARRTGVGRRGQVRAGTAHIARAEFSIVIEHGVNAVQGAS